jgi:hypothetical protein
VFLGRHPCTGMKVAKLEIKLIVAMMIAGYDFDVVDANGKTPKQLPQPDRNDIHQVWIFRFKTNVELSILILFVYFRRGQLESQFICNTRELLNDLTGYVFVHIRGLLQPLLLFM